MAERGISYINISTIPPPTPPRHSPTVPPLFNPQQICDRGRQRHLRPPISLTRSNRRRSSCSYGRFASTEAAIEDVDPSKRASFCDSFRATVHSIAEGISASQSTAADGHWTKWAEFCQDMVLDPLLIPYRDLLPILNTLARQYQKISLALSICQVQS